MDFPFLPPKEVEGHQLSIHVCTLGLRHLAVACTRYHEDKTLTGRRLETNGLIACTDTFSRFRQVCLANISPDLWDKSGKLKLIKQRGDSTQKMSGRVEKLLPCHPSMPAARLCCLFGSREHFLSCQRFQPIYISLGYMLVHKLLRSIMVRKGAIPDRDPIVFEKPEGILYRLAGWFSCSYKVRLTTAVDPLSHLKVPRSLDNKRSFQFWYGYTFHATGLFREDVVRSEFVHQLKHQVA